MFCVKSKAKIWQLILWLLTLIVIMLALSRCSTVEIYPFKSVPRTSINEECKVFHNWGVSNSEFMKWVYKMIDGTDYIEIRTIDGKCLEGTIAITMAVVYYKK